MEIITVKLTKHQTKLLQPLLEKAEAAYRKDAMGAIIGQFYPKFGFFKCRFCNNKQLKAFHDAFKEV